MKRMHANNVNLILFYFQSRLIKLRRHFDFLRFITALFKIKLKPQSYLGRIRFQVLIYTSGKNRKESERKEKKKKKEAKTTMIL